MFLVLMRSPRRVDELSFLVRRIPTIKTLCIEERSEENKNKIKFSLSRSLSLGQLPFAFAIFVFYHFYFIIIILIWIHSSYYFIRVRFYPENFYFFSIHFILNELSPSHFMTSEIFVKISSLKSLATYHPKNRKIFQRSQNLTKLFWITRFRETNSTAQSVSSSEI